GPRWPEPSAPHRAFHCGGRRAAEVVRKAPALPACDVGGSARSGSRLGEARARLRLLRSVAPDPRLQGVLGLLPGGSVSLPERSREGEPRRAARSCQVKCVQYRVGPPCPPFLEDRRTR